MKKPNGVSVEITMPRVVFATPTLDHRVSKEFCGSLLQTSRLLAERNIGHDYIFLGGDCYLWKVRNKLVKMFLAGFPEATDLFFLDEDVGWQPEKVVEFLLRPEAVVAGVYPKKTDNLDFPVQLLGKDGGLIENGGFYMAGNVGAGFLRVKRKVLEVLSDLSVKFREHPGGEEYPGIFEEGIGSDGLAWGEDYTFVQKVIAQGGEVWIDPDIEFTHRGTKVWSAKLSDHIGAFAEKAKASQKGGPTIIRRGVADKRLEDALEAALSGKTDLQQEILDMEGMSGTKYRIFINALMRSIDYPRYLEIGSWKGSTAIAACYKTTDFITCIDNWSEYGGPREEFLANMNAWCPRHQVYDHDFREVVYVEWSKHNVFLYDGPHDFESQRQGVTLLLPALDREYFLIVDDWNWDQVREGTFAGLEQSGQEIVSAIEIRTDRNPEIGERSDWHNGYFIAVVRQSEAS